MGGLSKAGSPPRVGGHIQPTEGLHRTKRPRKKKFSLRLTAQLFPALAGLTASALLVLRPSDWTGTPSPAVLGLQLTYRWQVVGPLGLLNQ